MIVEGLTQGQKGSYYVKIGQIQSQQNVIRKIAITNIGTRPAYVKALAFEGEIWGVVLGAHWLFHKQLVHILNSISLFLH